MEPEGIQVRFDVMNLYKLESGKVKEWQILVNNGNIANFQDLANTKPHRLGLSEGTATGLHLIFLV